MRSQFVILLLVSATAQALEPDHQSLLPIGTEKPVESGVDSGRYVAAEPKGSSAEHKSPKKLQQLDSASQSPSDSRGR